MPNQHQPDIACRVLLDSSAFSAWNRGEKIDLDSYIEFVKRNAKYIWAYINLDVIPGEFGRKVSYTRKELANSASRSRENLLRMKDAGLKPMPVFHQGEAWDHLERMLDEGEEYIGLSVFKDRFIDDQRDWLDECFTILTDTNGRVLCRVHGFSMTRPALLTRYPWYTVDSTTWALHAGYGRILVPRYVNGAWDYSSSESVVVSGKEQGSLAANRQRLDYIAATNSSRLDEIRGFLEQELALSFPEVRYSVQGRRQAIAMYQKRVEDLIGKLHPFYVMFATSPAHDQSLVLNRLGIRDRLVSFVEFKDRPDEHFREYVLAGKLPGDYTPQIPRQDWQSERYANYRKLCLCRRIEEKKALGPGHDKDFSSQ